MKKLLFVSVLSCFVLTSHADNYLGSTPSQMSALSIVLSPLLSSVAVEALLKDLSASNKPLKVTAIEHKEGNKSTVKCMAQDKPMEFTTDTAAVNAAKLQANSEIAVQDAKLGYVLNSNDVTLGIVAHQQYADVFSKKKLN